MQDLKVGTGFESCIGIKASTKKVFIIANVVEATFGYYTNEEVNISKIYTVVLLLKSRFNHLVTFKMAFMSNRS